MSKNTTTNFVNALVYEPGNATRYDLIVGCDDGGRCFVTWMHSGGGGGTCAFSDFAPHWTYLADKMRGPGGGSRLPTEADAREALVPIAERLLALVQSPETVTDFRTWWAHARMPGRLRFGGRLVAEHPGVREGYGEHCEGRR